MGSLTLSSQLALPPDESRHRTWETEVDTIHDGFVCIPFLGTRLVRQKERTSRSKVDDGRAEPPEENPHYG